MRYIVTVVWLAIVTVVSGGYLVYPSAVIQGHQIKTACTTPIGSCLDNPHTAAYSYFTQRTFFSSGQSVFYTTDSGATVIDTGYTSTQLMAVPTTATIPVLYEYGVWAGYTPANQLATNCSDWSTESCDARGTVIMGADVSLSTSCDHFFVTLCLCIF